jgi:hypothetical protein
MIMQYLDGLKPKEARKNLKRFRSAHGDSWHPSTHVCAKFNPEERLFVYDEVIPRSDVKPFKEWLQTRAVVEWRYHECQVQSLYRWLTPMVESNATKNTAYMDPEDWLDALERQLECLDSNDLVDGHIQNLPLMHKVCSLHPEGRKVSVYTDEFEDKKKDDDGKAD